jgi:MFS family permease
MVAPTASGTLDTAARRVLQRRTLRVLVVAQILGGLGGSGAAAGALLALDITGDESLASLPLALLVLGSSAAVVPISSLSSRKGRRIGLTVALGIAAVGAAGVVGGGALRSFALVCAASALFGVGNTAVMLARYAAADLSTPGQRGRAIGSVVFATTFGAVAGPNLLAPAGGLASAFGLPDLTGLFLCSAAAFMLAGLVLFGLLRPDPLQVAAAVEVTVEASAVEEPPDPAKPSKSALRSLLARPAAVAGLMTMLVANFVMVAVMVMAPVHMGAGGHGLEFIGLAISLHIAGMFAPSPITGWLTDRVGSLQVATAGAALLVVSGVLSATAGASATVFAAGLLLLGVGWNLGLIAGSALLASAVPLALRPRAEGIGELSMGVAAGIATAIAGPVVGIAGYATLAVAAATSAAILAPVLVAVGRRGAPAGAAPAPRVLA